MKTGDAFGGFTRRQLRNFLGVKAPKTIGAHVPLAVRAKWQGRRGSSVWQRQRMLADVLVGLLADMEVLKDRRGLEWQQVHEAMKAVEELLAKEMEASPQGQTSARQALGQEIGAAPALAADARPESATEWAAQFGKPVVKSVKALAEALGGWASYEPGEERMELWAVARQVRREAAQEARQSVKGVGRAGHWGAMDRAMATLAELAAQRSELVGLLGGVTRYWKRRGASGISLETARRVKVWLPERVYESVESLYRMRG